MSAGTSAGLALLTDGQGKICEILHNALQLSLHVGESLASIVHTASQAKSDNFFLELARNGAAFDWHFDLERDGHVTTLFFAGSRWNDMFLIVAAPSRGQVGKFYHEFMTMHNEQLTTVRTLMKEQSLNEQSRNEQYRNEQSRNEQSLNGRQTTEDPLYEELSRVNNELATAQRQLAKKHAELARLNEQKNQFLGIVSHDLRNPLAIIRTYSQFLLDEATAKLTSDEIRFVSTIVRTSDFMLALVNDLLDLTKIESGKLELDLEATDLAELLTRNVELNRILAQRRQQVIRLDVTSPLPLLWVDPYKIEQVFNNIISNASKYSADSATIAVSLGREGNWATFAVSDNGMGIPQEELAAIFDPYQTTRLRSSSGEKSTGLGLAIVKRIVEGHHGELDVRSVLGAGTTFTVRLPFTLSKPPSGKSVVS